MDEVQNFASGLSSYVRVTHPPLGMRRDLILGVEDNRTSEAVGHRRLQSVPSCLLHGAQTTASEPLEMNEWMRAGSCYAMVIYEFFFLQ